MKAIHVRKAGGPEVLELKELPQPVPGKDEVLVKVMASSVSKGDTMMRKLPRALISVLGFFFGFKVMSVSGVEYAGTIVACGSAVKQFKPGQSVFGTTTGLARGANAEYVVVPATPRTGVLLPMPQGTTFDQMALVPVGAMTAHQLLGKAGLKAGMRVLVHGASGSVGTYAVQLARIAGARVTAVCSASNVDLVKSLGADTVIDYTTHDFAKVAGPQDLVFDAAGKTSKGQCKELLAPGGRYVSVKSPTTEDAQALAWLGGLVAEGKVQAVCSQAFTLETVPEAHRLVDAGHKRGNFLVRIGSLG